MASRKTRDDYDSPWKEALEKRFEEFLSLLFPAIHKRVDWRQPIEFLDKELLQVVRDADKGRRQVDKLVKVHTLDGSETWLLIHVEVQGRKEEKFPWRMYVYHYRLTDRYAADVVSLGVLTDRSKDFKPEGYQWERWGCRIDFKFPICKLIDYEGRWAELEASRNVFALVVMAQLKALRHKGDERRRWKMYLMRILYERDYDRATILELFRVIDWMMRLPEVLEQQFLNDVYALEEAKKMPYVTSAERFGLKKGREEGMREGMREGESAVLLRQVMRKYGSEAADRYHERFKQADANTLLEWSERLLSADRIEEIFTVH